MLNSSADVLSTQTELERLASLWELDILDTPEEQEFDEIVRLASEICDTPISAVSLVDKDRQWFKASVGLNVKETPRNISFCSHAIQRPGLFEVHNATEDPRFKHNPLVVDDPGIRFYAGFPLHAPGGAAVGARCVIDTVPRVLTENQRNALAILSRQVQARMELRAKQKLLENALRDKIELTNKLASSMVIFEAFVNNSPNLCYLKSEDGKYITYNTSFAEFFGIGMDSWLGKADHELFPEDADERRKRDDDVLNTGQASELLIKMADRSGNEVWHKSIKFPIRGSDGRTFVAGVVVDVTHEVEREKELSLANQKLEQLARTDSLTGLANRRVFEERISTEFATATRKGRSLSLLVLDIDDFKKRNDTYGHASGDEALRSLSKTLLTAIRIEDVAARIGGEEFAIILPDTNLDGSKLVAERVLSRVRQADTGVAALTVSIGVACAQPGVEDWAHFLSRADEAMYTAKKAGKDRYAVSEG